MTLQISVLEIYGVKEIGDEAVVVNDDKADYFCLYGLVEGEANGFYVPIGDYIDRSLAELVKDMLDNKKHSPTTV